MKQHILIIVLVYLMAHCKGKYHTADKYGVQSDQKHSLNDLPYDTAGPYFPKKIVPEGYHLWIHPVPESGYFKGQVDIIISCLIPTKFVKLHAGKLLHIAHADIRECIGNPQNGTCDYRQTNNLLVEEVNRREPEHWCELKLSDKLKKGMLYKLSLSFFGDLPNNTIENGIYQGKYSQDETKDRWFVAANLYPNKARNIFPCLDDFGHKATFKISIGHPKNKKSITIMPLYMSEDMLDKADWVWDHFDTTPLMSPFSFNFYIFDPEAIQLVYSSDEPGSTKLQIFGNPQLRENLQWIGRKLLQTVKNIENYLQRQYPLPTLQIVISPNLLVNYGGFGLLTFSEEERNTSCWLHNLLFSVADQWFFHLTSPHSWSQTALGDTLSKYVSITASQEVLKDTMFSNLLSWGSMYVSASMSVIFGDHQRPFDNIIGLWTMRMLNHTLSERTVKLGISNFLNDRLYKTYTSSDILTYINEQVQRDNMLPMGITLQHVAKSWLNTKYLPVVSAIRNYERRKVHVKQQIFMINKSLELPDEERHYHWYMPVELIRSDELLEDQQNVTEWMMGTETTVMGNMPASDAFIILDPETSGLCIVNYDQTNWALIKYHLYENQSLVKLSATARAKLIIDSYLLAGAGELPFNVTFDMSLILIQETDFEPWYAFKELFWDFHYVLQRTRVKTLFQSYVRWLSSPLYEQYGGYGGEDKFEDRTVQDLVAPIMCYLGAEDCVEALSEQFVPGNEMNCNVLMWGNYSIWNESLYWALGNSDLNLLRILASCTQHKERINQLLNIILLNGTLNATEILDVVEAIKEPYILFSFVSDNWLRIKNMYQNNQILLKTLVYASTSEFGTVDGEDLVRTFYAARKNDTPVVLRALDSALDRIAHKRQWFDRALPQIESWLQRFSSRN